MEILRLAMLNSIFGEAAKYVYFRAQPQEINFHKDIGDVSEEIRNYILETFGKNWKKLTIKNQSENINEQKRTIAKLSATLGHEVLQSLHLINFPKIYMALELLFPLFHNLRELTLIDVQLPYKLSRFLDNVATIEYLKIKKCHYSRNDPFSMHEIPALPNLSYLSVTRSENLHTQDIYENFIRFPKIRFLILAYNTEKCPLYEWKRTIIETMPFLRYLVMDMRNEDADALLSVLKMYRKKLTLLALIRTNIGRNTCKELQFQDELGALYLKETEIGLSPVDLQHTFARMGLLSRLVLDSTIFSYPDCPRLTFTEVAQMIKNTSNLEDIYVQNMLSFRVTPLACTYVYDVVKQRPHTFPIKLTLLKGTLCLPLLDIETYDTEYLVVKRKITQGVCYEIPNFDNNTTAS